MAFRQVVVGLLLLGSSIWGILLSPLIVFPFLFLFFLPGYLQIGFYVMYLRHLQGWSNRGRLTMWISSLAVHGSWLCLASLGGPRVLFSLFGLWWIFAVVFSLAGLIVEIQEPLSDGDVHSQNCPADASIGRLPAGLPREGAET